jgi:hypothetical protein
VYIFGSAEKRMSMLLSLIALATSARRLANSACRSASVKTGAGGVVRITESDGFPKLIEAVEKLQVTMTIAIIKRFIYVLSI